MVLGILSIMGFGAFTAIVGLIIGIIGRKKAQEFGAPTQMATAGIIMSVIAIVLTVVIVTACIMFLSSSSYNYWY